MKKSQLYLHVAYVSRYIYLERTRDGVENYGYKKLMRKVAQIVDETMVHHKDNPLC